MIKCEKMKDRTVVKIEGNRIVIMEELSEIITTRMAALRSCSIRRCGGQAGAL